MGWWRKKRFVVFCGICGWILSISFGFGRTFPEHKFQNSEDSGEPVAAHDSLLSTDGPVYLYFIDPKRQALRSEERFDLGDDDPVRFCRQLVNALIQGSGRDLVSPVSPETKIRAIYIAGTTAYIDFTNTISESRPAGISSERMRIYSIVNTLVLNVDDVDDVKILIGGQEAETFSGHIDIRFPLTSDMLLIK